MSLRCTCPDTWDCPWCGYVCDNCEDRRIEENERKELNSDAPSLNHNSNQK